MRQILKDGHNAFTILYILGFLFFFAISISIYINSTFLADRAGVIFSEETSKRLVGLLYTAGSLLTIFFMILMPKILRRFGNYKTTATLLLSIALLMLGLAVANSFAVVALLFIAYSAIVSLLFFNFDVFVESYSKDENTGNIRGKFLTVLNFAVVLSPAFTGILLTNGDYWKIYSMGAFITLLALMLLTTHFNNFKDPDYNRVPFWKTSKKVFKDRDLRNIFVVGFLLRFFFAWMVIYMPIYLHENLLFGWDEIGIIFTVMLLPFVLFQIPAGKLADSKLGEKELLVAGFLITAVATISLSFITSTEIWVWAIMLFMTRVGASLIEVMSETYFFKHIDGADTDILGFFRNNRPLAYILGPIVASIAFLFIDYQFLFVILGVIMLFGVKYSLSLKDTL